LGWAVGSESPFSFRLISGFAERVSAANEPPERKRGTGPRERKEVRGTKSPGGS